MTIQNQIILQEDKLQENNVEKQIKTMSIYAYVFSLLQTIYSHSNRYL